MKQGKILLVGSTGFVGKHLSRFLIKKKFKVLGTYSHTTPQKNIFDKQILFKYCDVTKRKLLEKLLDHFRPDLICYLAALSSVRESWNEPVNTIKVNLIGGINLLEAVRRLHLKPRILMFSSSTIYGDAFKTRRALHEGDHLKPKDPYSISKVAIDFFSKVYAHVYKMDVAVLRFSNLIGLQQSELFSIANFASQIAKIEAEKLPLVMRVGNLSAKRDYLDIRDGLKAIYLAIKFAKRGEVYNIASGHTHSLEKVLKKLISISKLNRKNVKIVVKESLISKDEIIEMRVDASKFKRLTGWKPSISLSQSLSDILNERRSKLVEK